MISFPTPYDSAPLTIEDISLLLQPMVEDIETLLPLPATIGFYSFLPETLLPYIGEVVVERDILQFASGEAYTPVLTGSVLVIPIIYGEGDDQVSVALIIQDADPALLGKMSSQWLAEFQQNIIRRLRTVREAYTDPETGMYNKRALPFVVQAKNAEGTYFVFLSTGAVGKNVSTRLQGTRKTADILRAVSKGRLFHLGNGVYGVLLVRESKRMVERVVKNLQHHLKRDGISRVQIGTAAGNQDCTMVEEAWRCLAEAEKRGPFGVCDAEKLANRPFQLPSLELLRMMQAKWRGVSRFALAVFQWADSAGPDGCESGIVGFLQGRGECIGSEGKHTYVLFTDPEELGGDPLVSGGEGLTAIHVDAVGVGTWPCLRLSKTETVRSALKALRHCSFLDPGAVVSFDHLTLNVSGDVYFDRGDYQTAAKEYRRGLQLEPHDLNLLNSLGVTLVEFNKHGAAMKCFQKVLSCRPDNTMALVNLGFAQQTLGMKEEAMETLEHAAGLMINANQRYGELWLPLSRLYMAFGRFKEAVALLEQWADQHGSEKEFILFRLTALCCYELGLNVKAVKACQKALRLYPHDSECLSVLGVLYVEGGQGDDIGLRLCRQALEIDPVNSDNYLRLGRALLYMKEYDAALEAVKKCLQLKARHVEGLLLVSRIYVLLGKGKLAMKHLRRVMQGKDSTPDQQARAAEYYATAAGKK